MGLVNAAPLVSILLRMVLDQTYASCTAKWAWERNGSPKCLGAPNSSSDHVGMHIALRRARHSARRACIVSTRAARAAGTNDARTADVTTTAADPSNGIRPGS